MQVHVCNAHDTYNSPPLPPPPPPPPPPLAPRVGPGVKTHPESKCPELLAQYCDMLLRKTPLSKKLTSEEVEGKLKDVVRVN